MILDRINNPKDLREIHPEQLPQLCEELRSFIQESANAKPGHIRSSLGVTELSVALHYVMETPRDILIWDVGHQAYVHKVLTGRKDLFHTNRQKGGISGFTTREEGAFDPFGTGHSSTSISAAAGFAKADQLRSPSPRKVVAVIGDGSITAGMSFEAMNHIGEEGLDVLIILNDNKSSIDENRGALAQRDSYAEYCRALGINYLGECDGHNISELLEKLPTALESDGPRMLRVNTHKGKGFTRSEIKKKAGRTFQQVFGDTMLALAEEDKRLVVISPAMLSGGGLRGFAERYPDRCIDVGIAEQHAVTLAAGLAADGMKPVVHLYSTFAQRAYDQIIHDVALQNLDVTFVIDRAGLVGADGSTHHGVFDPGFFNTIPNLQILSPVSAEILETSLRKTRAESGPQILRIPKGDLIQRLEQLPAKDHGEGVYELKKGEKLVVFSFGSIAGEVQEAMEGLPLAHYNLNVLKPFPARVIAEIVHHYDLIVTIEENSPRGGLGDTLRAALSERNIAKSVISRSIPDQFIAHASRSELLEQIGLDPMSIREFLMASLRQ